MLAKSDGELTFFEFFLEMSLWRFIFISFRRR